MKVKDILKEEKILVNNTLVDLYKNPSPRAIKRFCDLTSEKILKGVIINDNVYWWDGTLANHNHVLQYFSHYESPTLYFYHSNQWYILTGKLAKISIPKSLINILSDPGVYIRIWEFKDGSFAGWAWELRRKDVVPGITNAINFLKSKKIAFSNSDDQLLQDLEEDASCGAVSSGAIPANVTAKKKKKKRTDSIFVT